jgi:hypothetical protein
MNYFVYILSPKVTEDLEGGMEFESVTWTPGDSLLIIVCFFISQSATGLTNHTLTASFAPNTRKDIPTSYFAALAVLESHVASTEDVPHAPRPALLNTAKSVTHAVSEFMAALLAEYGAQPTPSLPLVTKLRVCTFPDASS